MTTEHKHNYCTACADGFPLEFDRAPCCGRYRSGFEKGQRGTERNHTPGPWSSDAVGRIYGNVEGGPIARVEFISNKHDVANACLIARAPDLLAENERLRAEVKEEHEQRVKRAGDAIHWNKIADNRLAEGLQLAVKNERLGAQNAELLSALRALVEECREPEASGDLDAQGYDLAGCLADARAAIANAEGK